MRFILVRYSMGASVCKDKYLLDCDPPCVLFNLLKNFNFLFVLLHLYAVQFCIFGGFEYHLRKHSSIANEKYPGFENQNLGELHTVKKS